MEQNNATSPTIWIVTAEPTQDVTGGKSADSSNPWQPKAAALKAVQSVRVSVEKLEANMSEFLVLVGGIFKQAAREAENQSGMHLDEVELSVEITGNGEVKLVGTGVGVEAKGAITLKFKRAE
jgi:hypothetical protein